MHRLKDKEKTVRVRYSTNILQTIRITTLNMQPPQRLIDGLSVKAKYSIVLKPAITFKFLLFILFL